MKRLQTSVAADLDFKLSYYAEWLGSTKHDLVRRTLTRAVREMERDTIPKEVREAAESAFRESRS